ncbi:MAG: SCO family protein, partial [Pseudomonadota bacterium]
ELSEDEAAALAPLFITVDPERDTPETMSAFLSFDDRITGLTGARADIDAAIKNYKIYAQKQILPGSAAGYTYNHQSLFFVVDRDGAVQYALKDSLTPQQLGALLRRAIAR